MPTIKTLPSCRIKIYLVDHKPPHVHVWALGHTAKLRIEDGNLIAGSLPPKTLRAARRWLAANQDFAMQKWREIAEVE